MDRTAVERKDTHFELLEYVQKQMVSVETDNLVYSLPESEIQFKKLQSNNIDFSRVIWDRFYKLGYADEPFPKRRTGRKAKGPFRYKKRLKELIEKFQEDAGHPVDGWLGLQTWQSFNEIYSFEGDANLTKWFLPQYKSVLMRAVHLRLMILGVIPRQKHQLRASDNDVVQMQALNQWKKLLAKIDSTRFNQNTPEHTYIEFMFDIDKVTNLVASNFDKSAFDNQPMMKFLKCLLKVELWMYGYHEVTPGNQQKLQPLTYIPLASRTQEMNKVSAMTSDFIDEFDLASEDIPDTELDILEVVLSKLAKLSNDDAEITPKKESSMVFDEIKKLDTPEKENLVERIEESDGFGDWLFDGLKRVGRWLKNSILKAFDWIRGKLETAGKLLFKLASSAKKLATDAFHYVKRGWQVLIDGFSFLSRSELSDTTRSIWIKKDTDMDMLVFVGDNATEAAVDRFSNRINLMILRARAALTLANLIVRETLDIVRKWSMIGPLAIVSLLVCVYKMRDSEEFKLIKQAYASYD